MACVKSSVLMKGFEPCPTSAEWTAARKAFELPEEHNHNGRSEAQHPEEMSVMSLGAPVPQVTTCRHCSW